MRGKKIEKLNEFRQFIALVILGILIFFFAKTGFFKPIVNTLQIFSLPLQSSFHQTTRDIGNFFDTVGQIGSLRETNARLTLENSLLKAENETLKPLKTENDSLRAQLGTPNQDLKVIATAHPIGNGAIGVKNVLLIDQGSNDKISNGDLVIVGNILIGEIISVSPKISNVQLLSDPDTKIPAVTASGAEGIIQGQFGAGIELTNVVQESVLNNNELVMTSGRNSWPRGLVLGQISKINKIEKDFFQSADIVPTVDFNSLSLVYIIHF